MCAYINIADLISLKIGGKLVPWEKAGIQGKDIKWYIGKSKERKEDKQKKRTDNKENFLHRQSDFIFLNSNTIQLCNIIFPVWKRNIEISIQYLCMKWKTMSTLITNIYIVDH